MPCSSYSVSSTVDEASSEPVYPGEVQGRGVHPHITAKCGCGFRTASEMDPDLTTDIAALLGRPFMSHSRWTVVDMAHWYQGYWRCRKAAVSEATNK